MEMYINLLLPLFHFLNLASCQKVLKVEPGGKVHKLDTIGRQTLGVVKGIRSCGGPGAVLEWRYETCLESHPLCQVPTDGISRISQIDFVPSGNIKSLGLRFSVRSVDGKVANAIDVGPITTAIPSATLLRKGTAYTVTAVGGVTQELKGKKAVFQYILYNTKDNRVETCAEADLQYV